VLNDFYNNYFNDISIIVTINHISTINMFNNFKIIMFNDIPIIVRLCLITFLQ